MESDVYDGLVSLAPHPLLARSAVIIELSLDVNVINGVRKEIIILTKLQCNKY